MKKKFKKDDHVGVMLKGFLYIGKYVGPDAKPYNRVEFPGIDFGGYLVSEVSMIADDEIYKLSPSLTQALKYSWADWQVRRTPKK